VQRNLATSLLLNTNFQQPETKDIEKYPNVNWYRSQSTSS